MELADIISVNELFQEIYPYIAKQIASEYNQEEGRALEIGPYGPGISIALARLLPKIEITAGDGSSQINDYLRQKIAEAGLSHRIRVQELDKFHLPFPEESFDLVYFRGALFFWENSLQIVKEAYRVLTPLGLAMLGGGFGADTPEELVEKIAPKSRELNRRLAKVVLTPEDAVETIMKAGLSQTSRLETRRGLWIVVRK